MWSRPGRIRVEGSLQTVAVKGPNYSAGLFRSQYGSWPNSNVAIPTFFDGKTATATTATTDFEITLTAAQTNIAYQWLGYFKPDYTGTWTFTTAGVGIDDTLTVWVGDNAKSGYTSATSILNVSDVAGVGTVNLTAGKYYPMRVQYANDGGPGTCTLWYSHPGQTQTKTYTGKLFYNPVTKSF
jgi:hypothetical protein